MEQKDITLTIDGKMHKLMEFRGIVICSKCSLRDFCNKAFKACSAYALGGAYFVELKVEK